MESLVQIGDVKELVVALIDHGLEIYLMSMDFYKKGKWPINTKHSVAAICECMLKMGQDHWGLGPRSR